VGENNNIPLFDTALETPSDGEDEGIRRQTTDQRDIEAIPADHADSDDRHIPTEPNQQVEPIQPEIRHSSRIVKPSTGIIKSKEYQQREEMGRQKGEEWTTQIPRAGSTISLNDTQNDYTACLVETKASHNIPHSYRHAMSSDPD